MRKIAIYTPRWSPSIGGIETHISNLVNNSNNFNFEILTNAVPEYPNIEQFNERTTVLRFGPDDRNFTPLKNRTFHKISFPYRYISDLTRQNNIQKYINCEKFDILHDHYPNIPHTFAKMSRIFNRPVSMNKTIFKTTKPRLLTIHGLLHKLNPDIMFKKYEDFIINSYNNIICVDKMIYEYVKSLPNSNNNNIWFIPNSIETKLFAPTPLVLTDKLKIGFVGRLEQSRGLKHLEELIAKQPEYIDLHIIGSANSQQIENFKKKNAVANLHFQVNMPNEKLPDFFRSIDVLFNPVLAEGISRISLEAMACGRPAIMIQRGDRYPVINGETGYLVQPDIDEVIKMLGHINENSNELRKIAIKSRIIVENEFSNQVVIPKIEEIYDKVLKGEN